MHESQKHIIEKGKSYKRIHSVIPYIDCKTNKSNTKYSV